LVGKGFLGDYRGPESNGGGSFRIRHLVSGSDVRFRFGDTYGIVPPFQAPGIRGTCGGGVIPLPLGGRKIRLSCSGYNGLLGDTVAPPIFTDISIRENAAGEVTSLKVQGTGYPALEIWQYGGPGGPKQIFDYPAAGKGAEDLYGIAPLP